MMARRLIAGWTRGPATDRQPGRPQPETVLAGIVVLALWIGTRPYRGIIQDARLYAVQALDLLHGDLYRGDLYLQFGSQDQFTVFSVLYALVISLVGLAAAHLALVIAAQLLWLLALLFLCRSLIDKPRQVALGMAMAIVLPSGYGGYQLFQYGEAFLSARLPAEALTMLGMGLAVRKRMALCWVPLGLAASLHPVMAAPGMALAAAYAIRADRRWLWAVAGGAACAVALAFAGIPPFPRLLVLLDPEWLRIGRQRSPQGFVTQWTILDYARLVSVLALCIAGMLLAGRLLREFVAATAIVALAGMTAAVLGGDLGKNLLVVDVQPWRALWILVLAANIAAGPVIHRALLGDMRWPARVILLAGLAMMLAARISAGFLIVPPFLLLLGLPLLVGAAAASKPGSRLVELGLVVALLLVALALTVKVCSLIEPSTIMGPGLRGAAFMALALGGGAAVLSSTGPSAGRRALWLLAPVALLASALAWDRRTDVQRFIEDRGAPPEELATALPEGASVYWENGVELLWFRLRRASYFSCMQGAGVLYFRQTAIAYDRRSTSVRQFGSPELDEAGGAPCPAKPGQGRPRHDRAALTRLCGREPSLDYVVIAEPVEGPYLASWQPPASVGLDAQTDTAVGGPDWDSRDRFYIYRCSDLRE
ncbi:MAG: hypothetical protein U1E53_23775 [Dongiaceae bacterium]